MNEREFCFWLKGYLDLCYGDTQLSIEEIELIKKRLHLVLDKTATHTASTNGYRTVLANHIEAGSVPHLTC